MYTACEYVHLVMRGHFWSRVKDGGRIIRPAIARITIFDLQPLLM